MNTYNQNDDYNRDSTNTNNTDAFGNRGVNDTTLAGSRNRDNVTDTGYGAGAGSGARNNVGDADAGAGFGNTNPQEGDFLSGSGTRSNVDYAQRTDGGDEKFGATGHMHTRGGRDANLDDTFSGTRNDDTSFGTGRTTGTDQYSGTRDNLGTSDYPSSRITDNYGNAGGIDRPDRFGSGATGTTGTTGTGTGVTTGLGRSHDRDNYGSTTTTGSTGYGSSNTTSGTGYGDNTRTGDDNEYDRSNTTGQTKPTMGEKIKGGLETMVGKATKNPEMTERGMDRKTGNLDNDNLGSSNTGRTDY